MTSRLSDPPDPLSDSKASVSDSKASKASCAMVIVGKADTGVDKSGVNKSGVNKSGVNKSGVAKSGVDKSVVISSHSNNHSALIHVPTIPGTPLLSNTPADKAIIRQYKVLEQYKADDKGRGPKTREKRRATLYEIDSCIKTEWGVFEGAYTKIKDLEAKKIAIQEQITRDDEYAEEKKESEKDRAEGQEEVSRGKQKMAKAKKRKKVTGEKAEN